MTISSNTIEIVFIHKGYDVHLHMAILQAMKYHAHVTLISDKELPIEGLKNVRLQDIPKPKTLEKNYLHLSTNAYDFEYICIERWYILRFYLEKWGRSAGVVYLDSDVLISESFKPFFYAISETHNCALAVSKATASGGVKCAGHISYWTLGTLVNFTDLVDRYYLEKRDFLRQVYSRILEEAGVGGVCDMTLLGYFHESLPVYNILDAQGGVCCDLNISISNNSYAGEFAMKGTIKKVVTVEERWYGESKDGALVEFVALHFQGFAKRFMLDFYSGPVKGPGFYINQWVLTIKKRIKDLITLFKK